MSAKGSARQLRYQASRRGKKCYYGGCELPIHKGGRCEAHYLAMLCGLKNARTKRKLLGEEFKPMITPEK